MPSTYAAASDTYRLIVAECFLKMNQNFTLDGLFVSIILIACQQAKLAFERVGHRILIGWSNTHILDKLRSYLGD